MKKWIGISLGTLFGVSHIAMIGLLSRKSSLPVISPPVGPYTSYVVSADKDGYKISYSANDPKVMIRTTTIKEKGGFLGLANETKDIVEEYTSNGDVHIQKEWQVKGGVGDSVTNSKSEACIKAIGGGENTGRLVGTSIGTAAAPALSGIPFVGWVAAGWVAMFGGNQGAELGGNMAADFADACED